MDQRRRCLILALSLALPLAACAGEEGIGGLPTTPKHSDSPLESPAIESPSPEPSESEFRMLGLKVAPASVTLTSDPNSAPSARTATFTATAIGSGSQQPTTAQWVANPAGRVTITQAGVVSVLPAAAPGLIEVRASSGSYWATASVTISAALPTVQGLYLSATELGLYVPAPDQLNTAGFPTTAQLTATVMLSDSSTEGAVTWSVSPDDVASVDSTGRVTALKKGTALLTARSIKNPDFSAQCTLTVQAKSQVEVTLQ